MQNMTMTSNCVFTGVGVQEGDRLFADIFFCDFGIKHVLYAEMVQG